MKMLFTSLILILAASTSAKPTAYDQRQTGDLNVQIHLKDLKVVALVDTEMLEDYTDYNYSYDYSDFTIKPITRPSTPSGSTTTVSAWHTWPTHAPSSTTRPSGTEESSSQQDNVTTLTEDDRSTVSPSVDSSPSLSASNDSSPAVASSIDDPPTATVSPSADHPPNASSSNANSSVPLPSHSGSPALQPASVLADLHESHEVFRAKLRGQIRCSSGYKTDAKGRCKKASRRRLPFFPLMMKMLSKRPDQRFL